MVAMIAGVMEVHGIESIRPEKLDEQAVEMDRVELLRGKKVMNEKQSRRPTLKKSGVRRWKEEEGKDRGLLKEEAEGAFYYLLSK